MSPRTLALLVLLAAVAVAGFVAVVGIPTPRGDPRETEAATPEGHSSTTLAARTRPGGDPATGGAIGPAPALPASGATLEGQVVDRAGHGIAGAQVTATRLNASTHATDVIWSVAADADGHFLAAIPPDPEASFSVEAPGFRGRRFEVDPGGDHVVVPLWRAVSVRIRVRFEGVPPADGSRLRVVLLGLEGQEDGWAQVQEVEDGSLVFPSGALKEGVHRLSLDGPAGYTDTKFATPDVGTEEIVVPVRLEPGGFVRGVVRGIDGAPIEGAEVDVRDPEPWLSVGGAHAVRSDGAGGFQLTGLRGRFVRLKARTDRDLAESAAQVGSSDVVVRFSPPAAGERRPRPAPSATVSGVVLDRDGRPVDDAYVAAVGRVDGESWSESAKSDAEGRFRVSVRPGEACRIRVYSLHPPGQGEIPGVAPDSTGVTVQIEAHATIRGRVLAPGMWVPTGTCVSAWRVGDESADPYDDDFPSPDGRFAIEHLARGRYRIAARAGRLIGQTEDEVLVSPGETRRGVELRLREGARIEGQVLNANGRPVERATVSAEHPFRLHPDPLETDDVGRFRLDGLLPGPWTLHVKAFETGSTTSTVIQVGDTVTVPVVVRFP